jgi:hypothetical protein
MTAVLITLGEVLQNPDASQNGALFLAENAVWSLQTAAAVLAESDVDVNPPFAEEHGLRYAIGMDAVCEVVGNAKMQLGTVTPDRLLEAFLFYYDHDAFLNFPA